VARRWRVPARLWIFRAKMIHMLRSNSCPPICAVDRNRRRDVMRQTAMEAAYV
jgi:hypothetical protein